MNQTPDPRQLDGAGTLTQRHASFNRNRSAKSRVGVAATSTAGPETYDFGVVRVACVALLIRLSMARPRRGCTVGLVRTLGGPPVMSMI
jgi:hypothetical protein